MIHALYIGQSKEVLDVLSGHVDTVHHVNSALQVALQKESLVHVNLVIADKKQKGSPLSELLEVVHQNLVLTNVPVILLGESFNPKEKALYLEMGIAELCENTTDLGLSIRLIQARKAKVHSAKMEEVIPKMSIAKRAFDILFSILFLLAISPVLLMVAIAVRLDSKGPIIYKSKRVGRGYQVFDFLKFRTMKVNGDHLVKDMMKDNQYANEEVKLAPVRSAEMLIDTMGNPIDEETFIHQKKREKSGAFFKVKNDPRITRVGRFLRATSLDELPQFVNVLKGDMSVIGNRPLPLYEAEQLTTDQWVARFLAPAGITGLWQVEKRGRSEMSETERKELDNSYAMNYSFLYDMKLLLRTIPALMQKENV